jgi:nicotinate phosphoribosyltransferase
VSGRYEGAEFISAASQLQVEAVEDGIISHYAGDTEKVAPVIRVRGQYLDFAILETPILGVLTRATRIATNVYQALKAAHGKPVLFFPARFDLPEVQPVDGYAYWLAIQRYNAETASHFVPFISTDAQGQWWGGIGGGTVPHALIACFLADTAEAMRVFAEYVPAEVSRVALVDFNNDTVGASLATLQVYWPQYLKALQSGDSEAQKRWTLTGVRLDTARNMRDVSLAEGEGYGVNARLVRNVRAALDHAWESWNVPAQWVDAAKHYCQQVKIVVTGGFTVEKIEQFEADQVPVDIYGVGSTFLRNAEDTNTDFTMDVVRIKLNNQWVDIAKLGRKANDNPLLKPVDLLTLPE